MNLRSDELEAEEKKVLNEALSCGGVQVGPTNEYAADLRRRLLSATTRVEVVWVKPKRRVLLGSILGAGVAAIVLAVLWFWNAEPAWASAIRRAREQAWIHTQIDRDGLSHGDIWVSPEQDILAARLGKLRLFYDYKHQIFWHYDSDQDRAYRTFQPEDPNLNRELSSASSLASMFRRSPGAPSFLANEPIDRWSLRSSLVDGIPCDEYQIVMRPPDRAPTTLFLSIDKRQSLPRSLTIADGESHTTTSRFDYPSVGPSDAQAIGIPANIVIRDIDKTGEVAAIARSLREGRENFDAYTALCVTSSFGDDRPLYRYDVKRALRRGKKWRVDRVLISDPNLVLPADRDRGLNVWRTNKDRFRFVPLVICDGRSVAIYDPKGNGSAGERPSKVVPLKDDSADGFVLYIPERSCRPIFRVGAFNHVFDGPKGNEGVREGLFKIDVSPTPATHGDDLPKTYWLDVSLGNVAVKIVSRPDASAVGRPNKPPSSLREITLQDFRQSPQGFWYPGSLARDLSLESKRTTRFYVDFTDVPSDKLFGPLDQVP
jgi:hypothetical protein